MPCTREFRPWNWYRKGLNFHPGPCNNLISKEVYKNQSWQLSSCLMAVWQQNDSITTYCIMTAGMMKILLWHRKAYSVFHCITYIPLLSLYTMHCSAQFTLHCSLQCTVHGITDTALLFTVHCTVCNELHCTKHTALHFTVHMALHSLAQHYSLFEANVADRSYCQPQPWPAILTSAWILLSRVDNQHKESAEV